MVINFYFHQILKTKNKQDLFDLSISKLVFFNFVKTLRKIGTIVPLTSKSHQGLNFSITFDDGYKSNLELIEICKELKLPASIFINTKNVIHGEPYKWDVFSFLWFNNKERLFDFIETNIAYFQDINLNKPLQLYESIKSSKFLWDLFDKQFRDINIEILEAAGFDIPMNKSQLSSFLNNDFIKIYSHGHEHFCNSSISIFEQIQNFDLSISILRTNGFEDADNFYSIPFGGKHEWSPGFIELLKIKGVEAVYSTIPNNCNPFVKGRLLPKFGLLTYFQILKFIFSAKNRY